MFTLPHYEEISYDYQRRIEAIHDELSLCFEQHAGRMALPDVLNEIFGFSDIQLRRGFYKITLHYDIDQWYQYPKLQRLFPIGEAVIQPLSCPPGEATYKPTYKE